MQRARYKRRLKLTAIWLLLMVAMGCVVSGGLRWWTHAILRVAQSESIEADAHPRREDTD